jgi:hypothetical protein
MALVAVVPLERPEPWRVVPARRHHVILADAAPAAEFGRSS